MKGILLGSTALVVAGRQVGLPGLTQPRPKANVGGLIGTHGEQPLSTVPYGGRAADCLTAVKIESDEYKQLSCRMLLDTLDAYKPALIVAAQLVPEALARVSALPRADAAWPIWTRSSRGLRSWREWLGVRDYSCAEPPP